jgi:hypothetical protein
VLRDALPLVARPVFGTFARRSMRSERSSCSVNMPRLADEEMHITSAHATRADRQRPRLPFHYA